MNWFFKILLYILFFCFYLLLPGVNLVPRKNRGSFAELVPLAFTLSCAIIVMSYFISLYIKSGVPLFAIPLAFAFFSLFKLKTRKGEYANIGCRVLSGKEVLLLGLALIYVVCFSIIPNLPVADGIAKSFSVDQVWHMGNVNMLSNFSLENVRCSGRIFLYHFFNDVLIASIKIITRIPAFDLVFYYFPFTLIIVLFLTLKGVADLFLEKGRHIYFIWLVVGSTCASSFLCLWYPRGAFLNTLSYHLYTNVNAVACGWIFMLSYVIVFFRNELYRHDSWRGALIPGLIVALCTGTKGPFGFLLSGAVVSSYLLLFIRKETKSWKVPLSSLAAFVVVYKLLLSSGSGSLFIFPGYILDATNACLLLNPFRFGRVMNTVLRTVAFPIYFVFLFCGISLFYIWSLCKQVRVFPTISFENLFFHAVVGIGVSLFFLFGHSGQSQLYFFFGAVPFIALLGLLTYQRVEKHRLVRFLFFVGFFVGASTPFFTGLKCVMDKRQEVVKRVFGADETGELSPNMLTAAEVEGLKWLKNNSEPSDVFITNKFFVDSPADKDARWFYYSAFSERPCFLEGYRYLRLDQKRLDEKMEVIASVFSGTHAFNNELLHEEDVHFIVEYKMNENDRKVSSEVGEVLFSNSKINIYAIKND